MKESILFVRSLGCAAVVEFQVSLDFNLEPEQLEDKLQSMMDFRDFELERIIGEQGGTFYRLRLPHDRLFDSRRQGLLGALAQIERDVAVAVEQRELLGMVEGGR